ncbi:MAG: sulfatase-like hydrolase/transferase [Planctomycetota bacterium]
MSFRVSAACLLFSIILLLGPVLTIAEGSEANTTGHWILLGAKGRLALTDPMGEVQWEMPWKSIHDLHLTDDGLIHTLRGRDEVVQIDPSTKEIEWLVDVGKFYDKPVEVHSSLPLGRDSALIAVSGAAEVIEVRGQEIVGRKKLKVDSSSRHSDTRLMRRDGDTASYLVAHENDGVARRYGSDGSVIWEYKVPLFGRPIAKGHGPEGFGNRLFSAESDHADKSFTWIGTGNGHSVLKVDRDGNISWRLHQDDLPGVRLAWVTNVHQTGEGNLLIGNCHAGPGQPIVVEVDLETKQAVWQLDGHDRFGNSVSNTLPLKKSQLVHFGIESESKTASDNQTASSPPPNVIFILADDLGHGDVGFNGSKEVLTPNLDELASQSIRLSGMRANCTVCSPTRAAILSCRYADRVGVPGVIRTHAENSFGFFDPNVPTIANRLGDVGYHTAIVGKWHLGLQSPNLPNERGFDHFHGFLGDMMDDYYTHRRHEQHYMRENQSPVHPEGHATEIFTDWANDYLDSRASQPEPFFLYLAYNAPHFPIQPPKEWLAKVNERYPDVTEKRRKNIAFVEHLDHCVGQVLDRLDSLGLAENTAIVFTSDNGGHLGSAQNNDPFRDGKGTHYEGGLRVPCLVRLPGQTPTASEDNTPAMTFDLSASVLSLAGAKLNPQDDAKPIESITGQTSAFNQTQREHYFVRREGNRKYAGKAFHAIVRGDYKLLQNDANSPWELYNIRKDPFETTNLMKSHPKEAATLIKKLIVHVQRGGQTPWQSPTVEH